MSRTPTFWLKLVLAAGLVALANYAMFDTRPGAGVGLFSLAATAALAVANRAILRSATGRVALGAALALALLQIERVSPLGLLLFAMAFGVAALSPRAPEREHAADWLVRLAAGAVVSVAGPLIDYRRLAKARARGRRLRITAILLAAVLPVVGGLVFLALFALANPVISDALASLRLPALDPARTIFCGMVAGAAWAGLRPRGLRRRIRLPAATRALEMPGVSAASVTASLALFNAIFLLQNGLDIAFLWSGAALPQGVTFAEYAHRGAYPLIATALLAGLFVLVFLRPGSATAASPLVRALVIAWVAQNLFLVASTALRTIDYVDAYSLTRMRIAALFWIALVAFGLAAILWRLLKQRSAAWLIDANAAAVLAVLAFCCVVDLGALAAAWNVRHAREIGGRGAPLDLAYMGTLGGAAPMSLAKLERRPLDPAFRARVVALRCRLTAHMRDEQGGWRDWRWRDARRLAVLEGLPCPLTPPANPGK